MRRKNLRRLELWLPDTHFIWAVPAGCRAAVVRGYLDLGFQLDAQAEMLREILRRLEALEARLVRLEAAGAGQGQVAGQEQEEGGGFDAAGFFGMF